MLWMVSGYGGATQLSFSSSDNEASQRFEYRWQRPGQNDASLAFSLNRQSLAEAPGSQPNYSPARVQRYVYIEVMKAAQDIDPKQARVNVKKQRRGLKIEVSSPSNALNQQISQQLHQTQESAFDKYLDEHYYTRYTTVFNQQAVKPDHIRYIHEYVKPLIPLSQAIYDRVGGQSDARAYFNFLLSWVQSIPYDTLESRAENNGAGFLPPAGLLTQNKGDCDSKSVMTAAIARGFLPDTPMILILLPRHALLGVALTPQRTDQTLIYNDKTYILFEPTGPAQMPLGDVAADSERALGNGHYTIETI